MFKKTLISLAVASSLGLTGCFDSASSGKNANPDYQISNPELDGKVYPRFNPVISSELIEAGKALPIPSDLQFQSSNILTTPTVKSDGTFSDPTSANPSPAEVALGYLDGMSTVAPIDLPFNGSIKESSIESQQFIAPGTPNPNQNVFLLELSYPGGDPLQSVSMFVHKDANVVDGIGSDELTPFESDARINPSTGLPQTKSVEVPLPALASGANPVEFRHEVLSLDGAENNYLRITPLEPLKPGTRYLVVVTDGIRDENDQPITKDPLFKSVANPDGVLGSEGALAPVRDAALGWQSLAEAYFGAATNQVRTAQNLEPIDRDNIALTFTATTGGTSAVLEAYANPASFFERQLRITAKQEGIKKLVTNQYTLSAVEVAQGFPSGNVAVDNRCLNSALIGTLTDSTKPSYLPVLDPGSDAYDADVKAFSQLPSNADKAKAQATIAQLSELAEDGGLPISPSLTCGDTITFAQTALETVGKFPSGLLPQPSSRPTAFYTAGGNTKNAQAFGFPNPAELHLGQIKLPYYLSTPEAETAAVDLGTPWLANRNVGAAIDQVQGNDAGTTPPTDKVTYRYPFPGGTAIEEVTAPVLVQTPVAGASGGDANKANSLPVVIYQHGIFGERGHSLNLGNQLANAGYATVAIDMPLHGSAPFTATGDVNPLLPLSVDYDASTESKVPPFKAFPTFKDLQERHFGYTTNAKQEVVEIQYGDNASGSSGSNFINLQALQTTRDALRQAVVDLLNLNASIASIDLDGDTIPDLDPTKVYFVGHSLGGIVGTSFVTINNQAVDDGVTALNEINAAAFVTPGSGIARLLENSSSIGGTILAGLAKKGAPQGSSNLELFLSTAQASVDSVDPANFAQGLIDTATPVYINEIYGDGIDKATQDQTIPVAADRAYAGNYTAPLGEANPAPLSGTEPMLSLLKAYTVSGDESGLTGVNAVRFTAGTHTSIIAPGSETEKAVFGDMAQNIISFFTTGGSAIQFNNANFVKAGDPTPEAP